MYILTLDVHIFLRTFSNRVYTTNMEKGKYTNAIHLISTGIAVTTGIVACHYAQKFILERADVEPLTFFQSFVVTYAISFLNRGVRLNSTRKAEK